jgi:hypothetical protein
MNIGLNICLKKLVILPVCISMASCTAWFGVDEGNIVVKNAIARTGGAGCVISPDDPIQPSGVLDLSVGVGYTLPLKVANLVEDDYLNIREANVYFTDGDTQDTAIGGGVASEDLPGFPGNFVESIAFTGIFPSTERYTPATGVILAGEVQPLFVQAITQEEALQMSTNTALTAGLITSEDSKTIIAHVVLKAETGQGAVTFSNEFAFPIALCSGCLVGPDFCPTPGEELLFNTDFDPCIPFGQDQLYSLCAVPLETEDE